MKSARIINLKCFINGVKVTEKIYDYYTSMSKKTVTEVPSEELLEISYLRLILDQAENKDITEEEFEERMTEIEGRI